MIAERKYKYETLDIVSFNRNGSFSESVKEYLAEVIAGPNVDGIYLCRIIDSIRPIDEIYLSKCGHCVWISSAYLTFVCNQSKEDNITSIEDLL